MNQVPDFLKFIALAIPFLGLGLFASMRNDESAERQGFSGFVTYIEWKSRNHGMPLIEISRANGTKTKFHHHRIILDSSQLNLGDSFSKEGDSKICKINNEPIQCLK